MATSTFSKGTGIYCLKKNNLSQNEKKTTKNTEEHTEISEK